MNQHTTKDGSGDVTRMQSDHPTPPLEITFNALHGPWAGVQAPRFSFHSQPLTTPCTILKPHPDSPPCSSRFRGSLSHSVLQPCVCPAPPGIPCSLALLSFEAQLKSLSPKGASWPPQADLGNLLYSQSYFLNPRSPCVVKCLENMFSMFLAPHTGTGIRTEDRQVLGS